MKKPISFLGALLCALMLCSQLNAQTLLPMPAHDAIYSGSIRGYWFTAPCPFTITGLRVPVEAGTTMPQYIQVIRCNDPFPIATSGSTNFNTLVYISGAPNGVIQNVNIPVNTGERIGILGSADVDNSYSASAIHTSTLNGFPIYLTRLGYQGDINLGPAPNYWGNAENTAGSISRIEMYYTTGPCVSPPTAGATAASSALVCSGAPTSLSLTGATAGNGQTYEWQSSSTLAGPYTSLGPAGPAATITVNPTANTFYQAIVTCGAATATSTPVQVNVNTGMTGTYTINAGAPASPTNFQSFGAAVSALSCGVLGPVTINVIAGSGPYNEQVIIPALTGVSATNTVTINGNNNTLSFAASVSGQRATLKFEGADYVTVNNLNIEATGTSYGHVVQLFNNSDYITINGCTLTTSLTTTSTSSHSNVVISGSATSPTTDGSESDNITISNNTIIGGFHGVTMVADGATLRVDNNKIINNNIRDFHGVGIMIEGQNNLLIEGNEISRPTRTVSDNDLFGMDISDMINSRISKNRIHNFAGGDPAATSDVEGISIAASDALPANPNIISNNLIYNMNTASGYVYGLYNSSSDNARYYHNTVVIDFAAATAGNVRGFFQTSAATGIEFKNNIVTVTRGGTGAKFLLYRGTAANVIAYSNNIYYLNAPAGTNNFGYAGGNRATLAAWQTQLPGQDAGSVVIDPLFTAPATGNFLPTAATINNLGTPVGIATDIINAPRSMTLPDIGAYEIGLPLSAKLLDFTASSKNEDVHAWWKVSGETNMASYMVERSADGREFTEAGTVACLKESTGTYNFTDLDAKEHATNNVLYYRLRMIDKNGLSQFSNAVAVRLGGQQGDDAVSVYPNPFTDKIVIQANLQTAGTADIIISNITGKTVLRQSHNVNAGSSTIEIPEAKDLPAGIYELQLQVNGKVYVNKIVK